jgi:carbon-monoxide dehydrogenase small subunit
MKVEMVVNGRRSQMDVPARMTLADCLRHVLGLTGTHVGCEHGVCGACTVMVDGQAVRACLTLAAQADRSDITTVEALASGDELSPLQAAFRKHNALQCGFCTPGVLMTLHALLLEDAAADELRIRDVLSGNLCRCTGYVSIVKAALDARAAYGGPSLQEAGHGN